MGWDERCSPEKNETRFLGRPKKRSWDMKVTGLQTSMSSFWYTFGQWVVSVAEWCTADFLIFKNLCGHPENWVQGFHDKELICGSWKGLRKSSAAVASENQSINQSIHPSIHPSINQSINWSINQQINRSTDQSHLIIETIKIDRIIPHKISINSKNKKSSWRTPFDSFDSSSAVQSFGKRKQWGTQGHDNLIGSHVL